MTGDRKLVARRTPPAGNAQDGPKLWTRLPATRYQPSTGTKKMILNGREMVTGGSIIMQAPPVLGRESRGRTQLC